MMESLLNLEESQVNDDVLQPVDNGMENFTINPLEMTEETAKQEAEREREREKYFMDPNVQAQIMYENYINHTNRILDGTEKRRLRREFLKNAKKGKYKKIFYNELHGIVPKSKQKAFESLN